MQTIDEQKRARILTAAAECFASQPFHKVLLSEVAETAGVGKGTLYVYFKSKEDLYLSVLSSGFTRLLESLRDRMSAGAYGPTENLEMVIAEIVRFAYSNPDIFELMRTISGREAMRQSNWSKKRAALMALIESIIREGVRTGEFSDPHPELTARFIPGLVRAAMIEAVPAVDRQTLTAHILRFVKAALARRPKRGRSR